MNFIRLDKKIDRYIFWLYSAGPPTFYTYILFFKLRNLKKRRIKKSSLDWLRLVNNILE